MTKKKKKNQRGPKPEHLKLEGDWQDVVKEAISKEKPEGGWPDKPEKGKKS